MTPQQATQAPSESVLLQRAKQLDMQAIAEMYDRYSPGLFRYAYRLLGESTLAQDCVAETFSRLLGALQKGNGHTGAAAVTRRYARTNGSADVRARVGRCIANAVITMMIFWK